MAAKTKQMNLHEEERRLLVEALIIAGAETDFLKGKSPEDIRTYCDLLRRLCLL